MTLEDFWLAVLDDFRRHPGFTIIGIIAVTILGLIFVMG